MGTETWILAAIVAIAYAYKNGGLGGLLSFFQRQKPAAQENRLAVPGTVSQLDEFDSVTLGMALARAIARESREASDVTAIQDAINQFKAAYLGDESGRPKGDAGK